MFLGTYQPRLDEKGRLILPAKFRDQMAAGVVITRSHERSLAVYPTATFEQKMAGLLHAPSTVKQVRDFQRSMLASASDEIPDKQGRVTIPPLLRRWAGLERDVVVIGAGDRAEIWDAEAWLRYDEAAEADFSDMNEDLTMLHA